MNIVLINNTKNGKSNGSISIFIAHNSKTRKMIL